MGAGGRLATAQPWEESEIGRLLRGRPPARWPVGDVSDMDPAVHVTCVNPAGRLDQAGGDVRPISFFMVKKKGEGVGAWQSHRRPLQEEGDGGLARKKNGSCHMSPPDECPRSERALTLPRAREDTMPDRRCGSLSVAPNGVGGPWSESVWVTLTRARGHRPHYMLAYHYRLPHPRRLTPKYLPVGPRDHMDRIVLT